MFDDINLADMSDNELCNEMATARRNLEKYCFKTGSVLDHWRGDVRILELLIYATRERFKHYRDQLEKADEENANLRKEYGGDGRGTSKEDVCKLLDQHTQYQLRVKKLEEVVKDVIALIENMKVPQTVGDAAVDAFLKFGPWLQGARSCLE